MLGSVPKCKRSDAGNSDMPKKSLEVFPLSEKSKVLVLIKKKNNTNLELL